MLSPTSALENYLLVLQPFLQDDHVSEILINRPGQVLIERGNGFVLQTVPELTQRHLMGLVDLIARYSQQTINEMKPLLAGMLPSGHRVQIVLPPATLPNYVVMAIRKQTVTDLTLTDYVRFGAFRDTDTFYFNTPRERLIDAESAHLQDLLTAGNYAEFLTAAVIAKKNILISGATSTGKTTFLNACLKAIPRYEHIVTLEDVREVHPLHPERHTALLTSKGLQNHSPVLMQDLVQASLRLNPDRIILGELRGSEAADFINAAASGHDGTLSSVHAANPAMAFMRLVHMVQQAGLQLTSEAILIDLHRVIDVVVQLRRRLVDGVLRREVACIYYADAISEHPS
jgi:type IV secretion system protein VirB11